MVKKDLVEAVVEVKRLGDRMMKIAMEGRFFMAFQCILRNRVGLMRKKGIFLRNYILYMMSLRRIF